MLDNQLIRLIREAIQAGFQANGWLGGNSIGWGDAPEAWEAQAGWDPRSSFGAVNDPAWGDAGLSWGDDGKSQIAVKQAYQPTQQGANREPTIYMFKLFDRAIGSPDNKSAFVASGSFDPGEVFDPSSSFGTDGMSISSSRQLWEAHFQISALVKQDPKNIDGLTASDIVKFAHAILQTEATRLKFRAAGVGLLRLPEVRNPYFLADRGGFEASPSFDFVVIHNQVLSSAVPSTERIKSGIYRV